MGFVLPPCSPCNFVVRKLKIAWGRLGRLRLRPILPSLSTNLLALPLTPQLFLATASTTTPTCGLVTSLTMSRGPLGFYVKLISEFTLQNLLSLLCL